MTKFHYHWLTEYTRKLSPMLTNTLSWTVDAGLSTCFTRGYVSCVHLFQCHPWEWMFLLHKMFPEYPLTWSLRRETLLQYLVRSISDSMSRFSSSSILCALSMAVFWKQSIPNIVSMIQFKKSIIMCISSFSKVH